MASTDERLVELGEDVVWFEHGRPAKGNERGMNQLAGIAVDLMRKAVGSNSVKERANVVRGHVQELLKGHTQVMVKITGSSADVKGLMRSADYIARGGKYKKKGEEELELENELGDVFRGVDGREMFRKEWTMGGPPIPEVASAVAVIDGENPKAPPRQVLKLIYSMPAHVGRDAVTQAAKASIKETFPKHQWVMAHHSDTDNQHTHVLVKMVDMDGKRMNPRKADLEQWRRTFSNHLNARGVEASATRRRVRLKRDKGVSQAVRELRDRGVVPEHDKTAQPQSEAVRKALANEVRMLRAYSGIAEVLNASATQTDRDLGGALQASLAERGRGQKVAGAGLGPKV
jgi:hypothetical protein